MPDPVSCCILACWLAPAGLCGEPVSLNWLGGTPPGVNWRELGRPLAARDSATERKGSHSPELMERSCLCRPGLWRIGLTVRSSGDGFATVAGPQHADSLKLSLGATPTVLGKPTIQLREDGQSIEIDTGRCKSLLPKQGSVFLELDDD